MDFFAMSMVQAAYALLFVISKVTMKSGMKPFVLITYRQTLSGFLIIPFAYFLERNTRPKITRSILFRIFLCSIFGATLNPILYFAGLDISTATIACAIFNLVPAMTFILAVIFRVEKMNLKSVAGRAKVIGTLACMGGAMILSLYKGSIIGIPQSPIHWRYANELMNKQDAKSSNILLGSLLLILSGLSWAVWLIIQAQLSKTFDAPYTSSTIMSLMGGVECCIIALCFDHSSEAWSLKSNIRIATTLYGGLSAALAFCVICWCVRRKGPLYVAVFDPVLLVVAALLSWAILQEKLSVGTVVGSAIIVLGLYTVLWGMKTEKEEEKHLEIPL